MCASTPNVFSTTMVGAVCDTSLAGCRGLVVVGSPKTLSSDGVWRSWIRLGAGPRRLPDSQRSPSVPLGENANDSLVSELDVSDLRPFEEIDPGVQKLDYLAKQ